eukprot:7263107-Alexandrium_andersonii.AAC.1
MQCRSGRGQPDSPDSADRPDPLSPCTIENPKSQRAVANPRGQFMRSGKCTAQCRRRWQFRAVLSSVLRSSRGGA